jgi:ferredoxin--NADP+ reductase
MSIACFVSFRNHLPPNSRIPFLSTFYQCKIFVASSALPNQLQIDYAISREMTNANGGKLYVQDALAQQADQLLERLQGGANIYFCGLKGMMPGILEALEDVCETKGLDFGDKLKEWQANHQWHVEVY